MALLAELLDDLLADTVCDFLRSVVLDLLSECTDSILSEFYADLFHNVVTEALPAFEDPLSAAPALDRRLAKILNEAATPDDYHPWKPPVSVANALTVHSEPSSCNNGFGIFYSMSDDDLVELSTSDPASASALAFWEDDGSSQWHRYLPTCASVARVVSQVIDGYVKGPHPQLCQLVLTFPAADYDIARDATLGVAGNPILASSLSTALPPPSMLLLPTPLPTLLPLATMITLRCRPCMLTESRRLDPSVSHLPLRRLTLPPMPLQHSPRFLIPTQRPTLLNT